MSLYDSLIHAFGTAATGVFSNKNLSVAAFDSIYIDTIITVFMLLFGVNFTLYYAGFKGNLKAALRDEELRFYVGAVVAAIALITWNIHGKVFHSLGEAVRYSAFQVSSIITTTGYATADFNLWPEFSKCILLWLMFLILLFKVIKREIYKIIHPRWYIP